MGGNEHVLLRYKVGANQKYLHLVTDTRYNTSTTTSNSISKRLPSLSIQN